MHFCLLPVHNIARRPLRSGLTIIGIAVAVGSFLALIGLSRGVDRAWVSSFNERGVHLLAVQKGTIEVLTGSLDEKMSEALKAFDGVADAAGELADIAEFEQGASGLVIGWAPESSLWRSLRLQSGRLPAREERNGIVLGQLAAEVLGRKPGDTIQLRGHPFVVAGIARQNSVTLNMSMITSLPELQKTLHKQGRVTAFNIRVHRPDDPEETALVRGRLTQAFPNLLFTETRDLAENNHVLQILRGLAWGNSAIGLVIALVVVLNTLLMSVTERTREIGIFKAVGWRSERILIMIVFEGLIMAALGSALGILAGMLGVSWLSELPRLRGFIQPEVTVRLIAEVIAATFVIGVAGSLYPAWKASRLNAVDSLRYE